MEANPAPGASARPAPAYRPAFVLLDSAEFAASHAVSAASALMRFKDAINVLCTSQGAQEQSLSPVTILQRADLFVRIATANNASLASALSAPAGSGSPVKGKKDALPAVTSDDLLSAAKAVTPAALHSAVSKRVCLDYTRTLVVAAKAEYDKAKAAAAPAVQDPKAKGKDAKPAATGAKGGSAPAAGAIDAALQPALDVLKSRLALAAHGDTAPTHIYILLDAFKTPVEAAAYLSSGPITAAVDVAGSPSPYLTSSFSPAPAASAAAAGAAGRPKSPDPVLTGLPSTVQELLTAVGWSTPSAVDAAFLCAIQLKVPPPPPMPLEPAQAAAPPAAGAKGGKSPAGKEAAKPGPVSKGKGEDSSALPAPVEQLVSAVDAWWGVGYKGPQGAQLLQALQEKFPGGKTTCTIDRLQVLLGVRPATAGADAPAQPAASAPHPYGTLAIPYSSICDVPVYPVLLSLDGTSPPASEADAEGSESGIVSTVTYHVPSPTPGTMPGGPGTAPGQSGETASQTVEKTASALSPEGLAALLLQQVSTAVSQKAQFGQWMSGGGVVRIPAVPEPAATLATLVASAQAHRQDSAEPTAHELACRAAVEYSSMLCDVPEAACGVSTVLFSLIESIASATAMAGLAFDKLMEPSQEVWVPTLALLPVPASATHEMMQGREGSSGSGGLCHVADPVCSGSCSSGRIGGTPNAPHLPEGQLVESMLQQLKEQSADLLVAHAETGDKSARTSTSAGTSGLAFELQRPLLRWVTAGQKVAFSDIIRGLEDDVKEVHAWFASSVVGATALSASDSSLFRLARASSACGVPLSALALSLQGSPLLQSVHREGSQQAAGASRERAPFPVAMADRLMLLTIRPRVNIVRAINRAVGALDDSTMIDRRSVSDAAADVAELCALSSIPRDVIQRTVCLRALEGLLQAADTAHAAACIHQVEGRPMSGTEGTEVHPWRLNGWAWSENLDSTETALSLSLFSAMNGAGGPSTCVLTGLDPTTGSLLLALHTPVPRRRVHVSCSSPGAFLRPERCRPSLPQYIAAHSSGLYDSQAYLDLGCKAAEGTQRQKQEQEQPSDGAVVTHSLFPADISVVHVTQPLLPLVSLPTVGGGTAVPSGAGITAHKDGTTFGLRFPMQEGGTAGSAVFTAHFPGDGCYGSADVAGPSHVAVHATGVSAPPVPSGAAPEVKRKRKGGQDKASHEDRVGLVLQYSVSEGLTVTVREVGARITQAYSGTHTTAVAGVSTEGIRPSTQPAAVPAGQVVSSAQFGAWPAWLPELSREHIGSSGTLVRTLKDCVRHALYPDGAVSWYLPSAVAASAMDRGLSAALEAYAGKLRDGYDLLVSRAKAQHEMKVQQHRAEQEEKQEAWKKAVAAAEAAAAASPVKKGGKPAPVVLPPQPEVAPEPVFTPPSAPPAPGADAVTACLQAVWVDTAADGSRRARVLLKSDAVSSAHSALGDDADMPGGPIGALPPGVPVLYLPLPPAVVYTSLDSASAATVTVRYDHCPVPDPSYSPPLPPVPPPKALYKKGRAVQKAKEAQDRVNAAYDMLMREGMGGVWTGVECDDRRTPIWDGQGCGAQRGRVATVAYPHGPHGSPRTLTIHAEGTHIARDDNSHRVLVACRGFATVEYDTEVGRLTQQQRSGAAAAGTGDDSTKEGAPTPGGRSGEKKRVGTSQSGPRTGTVITCPDGVSIACDHDFGSTSSVRARLRLHRPEGIAVVALDDGRVHYRHAGVGPAQALAGGAAFAADAVGEGAPSPSGGARSASPTGSLSSDAGRGKGGGTRWPGPGLLLALDKHADLTDGAAAVNAYRGLTPLMLDNSYTFCLLPRQAVRRVGGGEAEGEGGAGTGTGTGKDAAPVYMEMIDHMDNYFAVTAPTLSKDYMPPASSAATHVLLLDVQVKLSGCVLPSGLSLVPRPPVACALLGDETRGQTLLTAAVPGAPPGSTAVIPRIREPLQPVLFILSPDGRGARLVGPHEWELTSTLAAGGFGHGRLALGGWAEAAVSILSARGFAGSSDANQADGISLVHSSPGAPAPSQLALALPPAHANSPVQVRAIPHAARGPEHAAQGGVMHEGTLDLMSLHNAQGRSSRSGGPGGAGAAGAGAGPQPVMRQLNMPHPQAPSTATSITSHAGASDSKEASLVDHQHQQQQGGSVVSVLAIGERHGSAPLSAAGPPPMTQVFVLAPTRGDAATRRTWYNPAARAVPANTSGCGIVTVRGRDVLKSCGAVWIIPKPPRKRQHEPIQVFGQATVEGPRARRRSQHHAAQQRAQAQIVEQLQASIHSQYNADGTTAPRDFTLVRDAANGSVLPNALAIPGLAGGAGVSASDVVGDERGEAGAAAHHRDLSETRLSQESIVVAGMVRTASGHDAALADAMSTTGGTSALAEAVAAAALQAGVDVDLATRLAAALKRRYASRVFIVVPELITTPYQLFQGLTGAAQPPLVLWRTLTQHAQLGTEDRALLLAQERLWAVWRAGLAHRAATYTATDARSKEATQAASNVSSAVQRLRRETGTMPARQRILVASLQTMVKSTSAALFVAGAVSEEAQKRVADARELDSLEYASALRLAELELRDLRRSRGSYTPASRSNTPLPRSTSPGRAVGRPGSEGLFIPVPATDAQDTLVLVRAPSREELSVVMAATKERQAELAARAAAEERASAARRRFAESAIDMDDLRTPRMQPAPGELLAETARTVPLDPSELQAAAKRAAQAQASAQAERQQLKPYEIGSISDYGTGQVTIQLTEAAAEPAAAGSIAGSGGATVQTVRTPKGTVRVLSAEELEYSDAPSVVAVDVEQSSSEQAVDEYTSAKQAAEERISAGIASRLNPATGKPFDADTQRRMRITELKAWEKAWHAQQVPVRAAQAADKAGGRADWPTFPSIPLGGAIGQRAGSKVTGVPAGGALERSVANSMQAAASVNAQVDELAMLDRATGGPSVNTAMDQGEHYSAPPDMVVPTASYVEDALQYGVQMADRIRAAERANEAQPLVSGSDVTIAVERARPSKSAGEADGSEGEDAGREVGTTGGVLEGILVRSGLPAGSAIAAVRRSSGVPPQEGVNGVGSGTGAAEAHPGRAAAFTTSKARGMAVGSGPSADDGGVLAGLLPGTTNPAGGGTLGGSAGGGAQYGAGTVGALAELGVAPQQRTLARIGAGQQAHPIVFPQAAVASRAPVGNTLASSSSSSASGGSSLAPLTAAQGSTVGLSPSSARFGTVVVGQTYRLELQLHNRGAGPLRYKVSKPHQGPDTGVNGVTVHADALPVQRNGSKTLVFELHAERTGMFADTVQVTTPGEVLSIPVSARVVEA